MKTFLTIEVGSYDMKLVLASDADHAAVESPFTGLVAVHEISEATLFDVQSVYKATPVPIPTPAPKLTKPDRPSNVEALKPTVELPDLTLDDDDDGLPTCT